MAWTLKDEAKLNRMAMEGQFFYSEIAEKMGKRQAAVRWKARMLGLPPMPCKERKFGHWNAKHSHLRVPVMTYFLDHTWEQTQKKFKLTESELKSLFTVAYRDPKLKHLRKDTRRHDPWSTRELKFLLTHSGIMPRDWIGKKLKRGTPICVKERLERLGLSSRTLNGITLSQFREAFGKDPSFILKTKAGPGRNGTPTCFRIVPWVWLDQELKTKRLRTSPSFRKVVSTMAMFQEWIHGGDAIEKLKRIAKKRIEAAI